MKPKHEWIQYCYLGCLLILVSLGVVTIVASNYQLEIQPEILTIIVILWTVLLICFERNKKNVIPYLIIAMLAGAALIAVRAADIDTAKVISDYISWLYDLLSGSEIEEIEQALAYHLVSCMIVLIIVSIIIYLCLKRYQLRIAGAILSVIALIVLSIFQRTVSKLGVCCLLTYSFIVLAEIMYRRQYKDKEIQHTRNMTFLAPMLLLMVVCLMILPSKEEPIQWKVVKQCWYKLTSTIDQWFSNIDLWMNPDRSEFSLSFSGYSEDGNVGGTLSDSDNLALSLSTASLQTSNIYLTGNIKNYYDGEKWTSQTQEGMEQKEYILDDLEFLYAVDRAGIEKENLASIYNQRGLVVTFEYITTKSMFYPLKLYDLQTKNSMQYENDTANFVFDEPKHQETSYSLYYLNLNHGSTYLDQLIQTQEKYEYQQSDTEKQQTFEENFLSNEWPDKMKIPDHLESLLYTRAQKIRSEYTQVYEELPERVRTLSMEITKNCSGDYEKCIAIEKFLSDYLYTTTPKQPANGQDLLDFMLFDSREGYCTYYATAFAIIARCVSIPTRYVQGFCIPVSGQEDRFLYMVYNHNAHAWPEAYIEGVGWIPFEPTPSYRSMRYQPWMSYEDRLKYNQSQLGDLEDEEVLNDSQAYPDFLQDIELEKENRQKQTYRNVGIIAIVVAVSILLALPCWLLIRIFRKNHCYQKKQLSDKMYADMEQIFLLMSYTNQGIEPLETLQTYLKRLSMKYPDLKKEFDDSYQSYIRLRYEEDPVNETDQACLHELNLKLLESIKKEYGKIRYMILRIRLL